MEKVTIHAEKREESGKGVARTMRRQGMIPAIIYRGGGAIPLKIPKQEITQLLNTSAGAQVMINLQFTDGDNKLALINEFQVDPVKRELLHADFYEILLTEEVKVNIHLTPVGEPIGVKRDKGIIQHLLREIEIECLPDKIPGHVQFDISALEIGQSFRVSDLTFEEDIKILTAPDEVIVNIIAPTVEEEAPVEEAAEPEVTEPEVMKKGKKEEEKAAGEEGKEKEKEKTEAESK
jgi:large subunit ribosomal protein L25